MSGHETTKAAARIEGIVPILNVRSLQVSIDYYVGLLGFRVGWQESGVMAAVSRDRASIMLCEGEQGNPGTWLWIGVEDADVFFGEFSASGATIGLAPTNYPWAFEFHVKDPDGHVLRFGSDPKADRPFSPWVPWYRQGGDGDGGAHPPD